MNETNEKNPKQNGIQGLEKVSKEIAVKAMLRALSKNHMSKNLRKIREEIAKEEKD